MPTIPQRIASAFPVLCGQYGDVTKMAQDRERSRQSLYRGAEQVANAVDGAAAQGRIDELQQQLTKACSDWRVEARPVRAVVRGVWRASSLVECVNSVARMQLARHRRMTQGLLDLKRLYVT
jgi:hypothetical protein